MVLFSDTEGVALEAVPIAALEFVEVVTMLAETIAPVERGVLELNDTVGIALEPVPAGALELTEACGELSEAVAPVKIGRLEFSVGVTMLDDAVTPVESGIEEFEVGGMSELEPVATGTLEFIVVDVSAKVVTSRLGKNVVEFVSSGILDDDAVTIAGVTVELADAGATLDDTLVPDRTVAVAFVDETGTLPDPVFKGTLELAVATGIDTEPVTLGEAVETDNEADPGEVTMGGTLNTAVPSVNDMLDDAEAITDETPVPLNPLKPVSNG